MDLAILATVIPHPNYRESSRASRRIVTNFAKTANKVWRNCHKILRQCGSVCFCATTAAAYFIFAAVALAEPAAETVSFQWQQPSFPPDKIAHSAPYSRVPAGHFSGKSAKFAKIANLLQHLQRKFLNKL
jgi:hypothetical protein